MAAIFIATVLGVGLLNGVVFLIVYAASGQDETDQKEVSRGSVVAFCQGRREAWEAAIREEMSTSQHLQETYPLASHPELGSDEVMERIATCIERLEFSVVNLKFYMRMIEQLDLGVPAEDIQSRIDRHLEANPEPKWFLIYRYHN